MRIDDAKLKEILLKEDYLSAADATRATTLASKMHKTLSEVLQSEGLLTQTLIGQAIAESLGVPFADLKTIPPSREQTLLIPERLARAHHAVVFKSAPKEVTVATDEPEHKPLREELKRLFKKQTVHFAFAFPEAVEDAFVYYLQPLADRIKKIVQSGKAIAPEIIDQIVADAVAYRASDIHIEPRTDAVVVRFRVDGVMQEVGTLDKDHYAKVLNRIKVQALLPIDEHFSAQDGAMHYAQGDLVVDMRISILPTLEGEKIVIRLLSRYVRSFGFSDLGLSEAHQAIFSGAARKPFGMILVVGPTGSGKSTSLYALLKMLNRPEINITTIEDPVEYRMAGINQIQVNQQTNLTFAKGLRSIARQDPDIILVGEIRDLETTDIAINAALTGHLLLSTFHANDAATAIPRLLEMGAEPFLLSSTMELVMAQRLVRRICDHCRHSVPMTRAAIEQLLPGKSSHYFPEKEITLYKGEGCGSCGGSGFRGRVAIFEFIQVTPEMRELMLHSPSAQQVWELARAQGAHTLFEDGLEKVKGGVTTIEELTRVVAPPETVFGKKTLRPHRS